MSPIVSNFNSLNTPNVFLREATPDASLKGNSTNVIGVLVQSIRGKVGTPTLVGSLGEFVRKFGGYDKNIPEGFMFVRNIFNQGASAVKVVRVTDGTEQMATGAVSGTTYQCTTPGSWGNSVTLTVTANAATGYVDLLFKYSNAEQYLYEQVLFTDATSDRYYKTVIDLSGDDFVQVLVAGSTNPSAGTTTFTGGFDGTLQGASLTDTAYVGTNGASGLTGLVAFEGDDEVNFLCTPRNTVTVNSALVTHVALSYVSPRIAIISPAQSTSVSTLVTNMLTINNDQVIMTYPWLQIVNPNNGRKEYHSPVSFYAGVLSGLSYEQSPSRKQVQGVIGTERALTNSEVDTLSINRVSPITLLNGFGFVIRNGYNTSSVPAKQNITRRRAVNFFAKVFEAGSQQFVSLPHTEDLRRQIKSAFGSLLETEVNLKKIGSPNGGKPYSVKCDSENNPDFIVRQNKIMVEVQISLLAPADFVLITLDASEAKVITS